MKNKLLAFFLLLTFLLTTGASCSLGGSNIAASKVKPVTLKYWRVYDDEDAFGDTLAKYKKLHSYVTIEYKKFRYEEYEKELINALAEDRGPDIFSIPSAWLTEYKTKITPMPPQITMIYQTVKGSIKKEIITEKRAEKSLTIKELKTNFVDIVSSDVLLDKDGEKKIYGLPLYVDTLAMYYNPALLNNAGITAAPQFWNKEFQQDVKKLTKLNNQGNIIQSGVAMGGGENIERSMDILSLLMMQNGAVMMDNGSVRFQAAPEGGDQSYNPGLEALRFYTDFSNPAKEVYCWNSTLGNSLNLFTSGSLAIMFGYAYDLPIIKAQAPKLVFATAKMPQIEFNTKQVNYANYWVETVSSKSKNFNEAWDFIEFETAQNQVESYLKVAKKPTALRALIAKQTDDEELGVFADQVLTAQSWYRGKDSRGAENAFVEMIDIAIKNEKKINEVIEQGASKVQQTVQ
jgi:ABC-type glycerol-3-phosphate transport system substrate-binding protein